MRVSKVKIKVADGDRKVTDSFVDKGLKLGGHSALPDVDIDFASDRRQEIKEYLEQRYNINGKQRVFSAGTFSSMKLKAVLKDVARVHRVPVNIVNYITAIFDDDKMGWTELFQLAAVNKKVRGFIQSYPEVIEDIRTLMGQPRSASIHASAIIVTPDTKDGETAECFDFLPIRKMDNLLVSEFDGYAVDDIGLLKEDVLATKELAKLGSVIRIVNETYNKDYSIESITQDEINDSKTYSLLSQGYTQNVFQFASRGITRFIMDVRPDCIEDLIAINALFRPATLEIGATDDYIRYKHGEVAPVYNFGTFEATKNTFGIMTYQEQFMSIAHTLGGFDLGKTDYLRKAIGKKNAELMATLKDDFISGAMKNGCPEYEAQEIWHKIEVAGKYSFNRSHAAAYSLTSYCGAWLKANYPSAFYTVALQWADDKEIPMLMSEMEQCSNARIVPPDINVSEVQFFTDYDSNEILWSLTRIKMVGIKTVDYIIEERVKNGAFTSIENFIHRIFKYKLKKYQYWDDPDNEEEAGRVPVNARHIKHLILSGCFDKTEQVKAVTDRYTILEKAAFELGFKLSDEEFPSDQVSHHYFWSMQQINLSGIGSIDYRRIYDSSKARKEIKGKASYMTIRDAMDLDNEGKRIAVCATVIELDEVSYKDKQTGEKKTFCKIKLQQNNDLMELICWSEFYSANRKLIGSLKDKIIIVSAVIKYSDYNGANSLNTYNTSILDKL
ncbi:DNA polymerase-3 subunit alpha [Dysgonomonas alginatilytica]|uniref:DNA-directed DNA polymerase n=1 Tax=Dysgonomonas alginatilytica TaxID=1605892 RepID=A0A2V3PHA9_9BACT|nr:DNA polymerase III subunit alpha [Dysgonomonas alginatilytica]PXV57425.1 DNA polymerase-3 subunit alpha [Dysgonomonas alginatilytica]